LYNCLLRIVADNYRILCRLGLILVLFALSRRPV